MWRVENPIDENGMVSIPSIDLEVHVDDGKKTRKVGIPHRGMLIRESWVPLSLASLSNLVAVDYSIFLSFP